ncbi:MAG: DUF3108 domain-containing protein [Alistipes sp.]|nr:DUF3108 domain-containing protein [Candidatus Alistipes equi]
MKRVILFCILSFLFSIIQAQVLVDGETLEYRVAYKAKMVPNTEVAYVTMKTYADSLMNRRVHHIEGVGKTLPFFNFFFKLYDKYDVWIDYQTKKPIRFEDYLQEGSYSFRSRYFFDWEDMVAHTWAKSCEKPPRTSEVSLTEDSMDAISLYYHMRSLDRSEVKEGYRRELNMVLDKEVKKLRLRFIRREVCNVPHGKAYNTMLFACTLGSVEEFSFTDGSEFSIWISDDENKVPIMLESQVRVGSIRAYKYNFTGLRYALNECQSVK